MISEVLSYVPPVWKLRYQAMKNKWLNKRRCMILSLDCDTVEDADAANRLVTKLIKWGVKPILAVPGKRLEFGKNVYQRLAKNGIEFINHGYADHTNKVDNKYISINSYQELSRKEIIEDMIQGDQVIRRVLDIKPLGWRTPHFGTLLDSEKVEIIYTQLAIMGYLYSSSTVASEGVERGSKYVTQSGIVEFPLSGGYEYPFLTLDSWTFFAAPNRVYQPRDFFAQICKLVDFWNQRQLPGLLNIYVDPSHVESSREFIQTIKFIQKSGIENVSYLDLI